MVCFSGSRSALVRYNNFTGFCFGRGTSFNIALKWLSLDVTDDSPTLVQLNAWCQATMLTQVYIAVWCHQATMSQFTSVNIAKHLQFCTVRARYVYRQSRMYFFFFCAIAIRRTTYIFSDASSACSEAGGKKWQRLIRSLEYCRCYIWYLQ